MFNQVSNVRGLYLAGQFCQTNNEFRICGQLVQEFPESILELPHTVLIPNSLGFQKQNASSMC